jgi:threonine dehydrogenase-like Zn-dependent dehydrogenase
MKAVVFHNVGDIRLENVKQPRLQTGTDAIVRITCSAICGTDLHMVRGTLPGMASGTILGHEGVGIVEEVGPDVRNVRPGDRVVICSTIACGNCAYCRAGYFSQCDVANPNGPQAGTAFFGGPKDSGPFDGMQAEYVRVPYANVGLTKLPDEVDDDDAILLSDIFPTAWFGARLAEIKKGDTVAVFGCGPVGLLSIASARLMGAGRILAVDNHFDRLEKAREQGAEIINFDEEHPVEAIHRLTAGIGVDRCIDAVGVDASCAHAGPAAKVDRAQRRMFERELSVIAPKQRPARGNWVPGDAPSQALFWEVDALAKAGTLGIIGVYADASNHFPIGKAMNKNLTMKMGNCNHKRYVNELIELVRSGAFKPSSVITQRATLTHVIAAYREFDKRTPGWSKVELKLAA